MALTDNEILIVLKVDLQISATQLDEYLKKLIVLAKAAIQDEGIKFDVTENTTEETPDYTVQDGMLIEMYAAHLYRKRRETENAMPRMLRFELNNRLFRQKGRES